MHAYIIVIYAWNKLHLKTYIIFFLYIIKLLLF